jgi:hypothetical protein
MGTLFELAPGRRASVDDQLIHTYTRTYHCTDDTGKDEHGIGVAMALPIGTPHPSFPYARVASIDVSEDEGNGSTGVKHWICTVTYKNRWDESGSTQSSQAGTDPADRVEDPTLKAPDITVSGDLKSIPCVVDKDGKIFSNSVGDPLLPPQTRTVPSVKITVGRNFLVFPSALFENTGKVNDRQVILPRLNWTLGPRTLKLVNTSANPVFDYNMFFWSCKFTLELGTNLNLYEKRYLGWDVELANMGRRAVDPVSKKLTTIYDELMTSQPLADPQFLTWSGLRIKTLNADGTTRVGWENDIEWLHFKPDAEFNMSPIWS